MADVTVLIFHRPASERDHELARILSDVRTELVERHTELFRRAGAQALRVVDEWHEGLAFGEVLAPAAPVRGGVIVVSGGAVPLLNARDAGRLVAAAAADAQVAVTNNRYSSDVIAVGRAAVLRQLPPLPSDNALPRWLEELGGYEVTELGARDRLGLDLDTPSDVALVALSRSAPRWLRDAAHGAGLEIPRLGDVRALAADPHRELLVFGRASSATLRWLERNVRCRVRFLAEERGLRASSPLAIGEPRTAHHPRRDPRATLGLLLDEHGARHLDHVVAELGDGAIIDSRVLLAHRYGPDESGWPSPADRFASDLLRVDQVHDPWLKDLTMAAAGPLPILLGGHSLIGPGIRLVLSQPR